MERADQPQVYALNMCFSTCSAPFRYDQGLVNWLVFSFVLAVALRIEKMLEGLEIITAVGRE